jgi:uncharacterized protein
MTIISFLILIMGGMNWMSIGLLQYDFIAGFFGTQASIFSRLVYITIGVATAYILFDMLKNKGKVVLLKKKDKKQTSEDKKDILAD